MMRIKDSVVLFLKLNPILDISSPATVFTNIRQTNNIQNILISR